ncbi:hypothetical protein FPY71_14310 [Aureimonas fodinaquatilis]|uniref:Uncharacterized protein n=1 Tax=Aureimonas fodinaquatilis TaxID=2565783 RepID=A0A5B0DWV8_9HYPH|nr:hypothetical protein [Aureimonas fodinaquatilis]KAA0969689.1 hypothetical protein FPY71_14310 [Aureimonas fodinaquatilis]
MTPIIRGKPTTESEKILAEIGEISFLNFWTFPSPYRKQKLGHDVDGKGDGKELCDLLIVCGDDVIIFSDKSVGWSVSAQSDIAWGRWFKAAVKDSVKQIRGAERWVTEFPDRIFLDRECTQPLPVNLPPPERRRIHGVVVAVGAEVALKEITGHESGMPMIASHLTDRQHWDRNAPGFMPFAIGDVDPSGSFAHVFNRPAIHLLLSHLDTISDFSRYLRSRAESIRTQKLSLANGEDDALAHYLKVIDERGHRGFLDHRGRPLKDGQTMVIQGGYYEWFIRQPAFLRKIDDDKQSYLWDRMIEMFAGHVLQGTSIGLDGSSPRSVEADECLRLMARENRLSRRLLSQAVTSAYEKMLAGNASRFARIILPSENSEMPDLAYVFVIMAVPDYLDPNMEYEEYRAFRKATLGVYCMSVLQEHQHLASVIGIAVDAPAPFRRSEGSSEDLMLIRRDALEEISPEQLEKLRRSLNVMSRYDPDAAIMMGAHEYPADRAVSRQQRRAKERQARKARSRWSAPQ